MRSLMEITARRRRSSPASRNPACRAWIKRADDGEERYKPIACLIRLAEAIAEADALADVRKAGRDPRNWCAAMTFLERRHPSRFGRRAPEEQRGGVTVIVGVKLEDVQVNVAAPTVHGALSDGQAMLSEGEQP